MSTTVNPTTVVNMHHDVPYDVYIGRGSIWGNPFVIGKDGDRETVIKKYEIRLLSDPSLMARLPELRGKTLACFCAPQACHGHVLARYADQTEASTTKYVIALEEGHEGTLHTFTNPALWAWLHAEIAFPYGSTRVTTSIPGTTAKASVSIGSPTNDLAQALVTHGGGDVSEVAYDDYEEALDRLTAEVGEANVFSGLWY